MGAGKADASNEAGGRAGGGRGSGAGARMAGSSGSSGGSERSKGGASMGKEVGGVARMGREGRRLEDGNGTSRSDGANGELRQGGLSGLSGHVGPDEVKGRGDMGGLEKVQVV